MLHATAMIHLLVLPILIVHTASVAVEKKDVGKKINMNGYANSIDDEYKGCEKEMYNRSRQLLSGELQSNVNFKNAWNEAKRGLLYGRIADAGLTEEQLRNVALQAYTNEHIFADLNKKMREGRDSYDNFGLKSLHFLITHAIQTLNPDRTCHTAYRRTSVAIDITDTFVRFGSFASSSGVSNLIKFGTETCFIITTCHGANILKKSKHDHEAEVLIPPYEVFIQEPVTKTIRNCEHVYQLRSVGEIGIMKCDLVKGPQADDEVVLEL